LRAYLADHSPINIARLTGPEFMIEIEAVAIVNS
jgi:hypothetical protein